MPASIIRRAFEVCAQLGIKHLRLTGGEPTIHREFDSILAEATSRGFKVGLVTNGLRFLRMAGVELLLKQLSRCWVSAYGPTAAIHSHIGGELAPSFSEVLSRVGEWTQGGHAIGVSVLLKPGSAMESAGLLERALATGVRRLRFIPMQPDGRGVRYFAGDWSEWPEELAQLFQRLRNTSLCEEFQEITLNDPFDLAARFPDKMDSCFLRRRRMWSVVPTGDVYPCCFAAYETKRKLGNIMEDDIIRRLQGKLPLAERVPPCRAFSRSFWPGIPGKLVSCPVSHIALRARG